MVPTLTIQQLCSTVISKKPIVKSSDFVDLYCMDYYCMLKETFYIEYSWLSIAHLIMLKIQEKVKRKKDNVSKIKCIPNLNFNTRTFEMN